jgi:putative transposase
VVHSTTIRQAYRFALAPTADQQRMLESFCGASRFWFNQGLALVKLRLDLRRQLGPSVPVPWSYKSLCSAVAPIKDEICPWRGEVIVGCQQTGLHALGNALQRFSEARRAGRRVGFPRFRAKGRCRDSVFSQDARLIDSRRIHFPKVGAIRTKERTRKLRRLLERDPKARILRGTITRSATGRWSISFQVERSGKRRRPRRPTACAGVDLGLERLATLSTGQAVANSEPLANALRRLRRLQRRLDRQRRANNPHNYLADGRVRPGASSWAKSRRMIATQRRIARFNERVANLRREQAHQLTTALVREFGVIGVETLAVANLLTNRRLARRIADAGWATILQQLRYKTSWSRGSILVAADRFYPSSRTCSACGQATAKLGLGERVFCCPACGINLDRDLNAVLNLARLAQERARCQGIECHVAATEAETLNARGGQVRPVGLRGLSPVKREASLEVSRRREAPAHAA